MVDVNSGDYDLDADEEVALQRLELRRPQGLFYLLKKVKSELWRQCLTRVLLGAVGVSFEKQYAKRGGPPTPKN